MKLNRLMRYSLAGLASLLMLAPAAAAFADQPVIVTFTRTVTNRVIWNCDGFDLMQDGTATIRTIAWLDEAGNRVRRIVHFMYTGTFTNSVTGEVVTDSPDPQIGVEDYVNGGLTIHGLSFRITVRGEGTAIVDAGTIIYNPDDTVTAYGPHPFLDDDLSPLCELLD
jgi:hypothetical protein